MRLQLEPNQRKLHFSCVGCHKRTTESVWADLDGPAFKAYYCEACHNDPVALAHGEKHYDAIRKQGELP